MSWSRCRFLTNAVSNPIFWIEVVGGTLDPKNWMKTSGAKLTDNMRPSLAMRSNWSYGGSTVVGDAIRGPYLQDFSFSSAGGGVVRLDRSGTAWNPFGLVLAAASGRLSGDGPHQLAVFRVPQHSHASFLQLVRLGSLFGALVDSVLVATEGARNHGLY